MTLMKRFLRDVLILVLFCSAFYFLTLFAGGGDIDFNQSSNFSKDRKTADAHYEDNDWKTAVVHYDKLLEDDPFNELAYVKRAKADLALTNRLYRQYQRDEKALKNEPERLKQEKVELDAAVARSVELLSQLVEMPRYRIIAFRELISLYCVQGDLKMAMIMFEAYAASSGKSEVLPLVDDHRLEPLMSDKRFAEYYHGEQASFRYQMRW